MSGYYAYFTGDDGHITNRVAIFAANDEEAMRLAKHSLTATPYSYGRKAGRSRHSTQTSRAASVGGLFHSKTSYSNATPSGSFSSNQVSAASAFAKNLMCSDVDKDGHFDSLL